MVRGNVNAPIAVTRAAALFVLRVLLDATTCRRTTGIARALALHVPDDCVANARRPSAVAAGNVELSQRLTDAMLAALGTPSRACGGRAPVPAQGQGTMNNITFGGTGWTFYETLGGGQGASARGDGPSAVHVGMSNTRNTPIESLERAYPLAHQRYARRWGSGGAGQFTGGDGVVRVYEPLEPVSVTLLTERRTVAPAGLHGGAAGATGVNTLVSRSASGELHPQPLAAKGRWPLGAGDSVRLETPGGGGFGVAPEVPGA